MKFCPSCQSSYPGDFATCPRDQAVLRALTDLMPGLLLRGKYEILEKLGAGGMGAVYKARHIAFGETYAIKLIGSHLMEDDGYVARFRSEAVLARRLRHPNIVRIEDLDNLDDGRPFMVMEYVQGKSLRTAMHEGPFGIPRSIDVVRQACAALGSAHALGILHRDIKPDNMLLIPQANGTELVKVLDFGLAKLQEGFEGAGAQVATKTGMFVGTPQYASPEQAMARRDRVPDGRADLYALGIVLFELITGRLPFAADSPMGMLVEQLRTEPPVPHEISPEAGIPKALSAVVLKALQKEPAERYQTAEEMSAALAAVAAPASSSASVQLAALVTPAPAPAPPPTMRLGAGSPLSPPESVVPGPTAAPNPSVAAPAKPEKKPITAELPARAPVRRPPRPSSTRASPVADTARESSSNWFPIALGALTLVAALLFAFRRDRPAAPEPTQAPPPSTQPAATSPSAAGPEAPANPDEGIAAEVRRVLFASPALRDSRVDVTIANGVVTLTGEASNVTARDLATSLAANVAGVRRVFNTMEVRAAEAAAAPPATTPANEPPPTLVQPPTPTTLAVSEADSNQERVRILLGQAKRQLDNHNPRAAEPILEEVLKLDPNNAIAKDALENIRSRRPPPR